MSKYVLFEKRRNGYMPGGDLHAVWYRKAAELEDAHLFTSIQSAEKTIKRLNTQAIKATDEADRGERPQSKYGLPEFEIHEVTMTARKVL